MAGWGLRPTVPMRSCGIPEFLYSVSRNRMRSPIHLTLAMALLLTVGCRLESHPPPGVPADEAAIRSAVAAWLAKAEPWAQVLRADIRQDRDLASAWVVTSPPSNEPQGERRTLFVLRRDAAGWTVEYHGSPTRLRP